MATDPKHHDLYDSVAVQGPPSQEVLAYLKPFDEAALKASYKRFGNSGIDERLRITWLTGNHPKGGWPESYARESPVLGHEVVIKAFRGAPEMLPDDFEWTRIDTKTWGGTLKKPEARL